MKHALLTLMASAILCAATLGTAETLQEMEVVDHGITTAVVRDPNIGVLIVISVIPQLDFESNMGIIKVEPSSPGEWVLHLHPGTNLITFRAAEYKTVSKRLVVPKKRARKVEVMPLITRGTLVVESNPPGAQIFLDGENTDKQTPYRFEGKETGTHLLVLQMIHYQADTTTVDIRAGEINWITRPLQAVGYLTLNTVPSGVEVVIDPEIKEAITVRTPVEQLALKTGIYMLSAHKSGYARIKDVPITITKGETMRKELPLQMIFGRLTIRSEPKGAPIYIDGRKVGQTPYGPAHIQAKAHRIQIVPESLYDPWEQVVVVEEGKEKVVSARCEPRMAEIRTRIAQIRERIERKRHELIRLKEEGWWGMTWREEAGEWKLFLIRRAKGKAGVATVSAFLLNGLFGLYPLCYMFQEPTLPYRYAFAIQTGLGILMFKFIGDPALSVGACCSASLIVGVICDVIAYKHDKKPARLRREMQELEEDLQRYSLHYDPVKHLVMVQYTIRW